MTTTMHPESNGVHQIRTVNIRGKEYIDVAERSRLCHADEGYSMISQERYELCGRWVFSVIIEVKGRRYMGDAEIKFDAKPSTPDGTNPVECAQTSALGRALGFAGYGAIDSIASADEVTRARAESTKPALDDLIKRAKKRAMALDATFNAEKWTALLEYLDIPEITLANIGKVNGYLAELEGAK